MAATDDENLDSKVAVLLIGVGSAAVVVSIYHCIAMGWCNRLRSSQRDEEHHLQRYTAETTGPSAENSTVGLIPSFKYQKGMSLVVGDDEGTCPICLGEFEDDEELRTLPECMHTYHAPCIDMWLYSHTSCPMCRTDATPSPQIGRRPASNLEVEGPPDHGDQNPPVLQLQDVVVHRAR